MAANLTDLGNRVREAMISQFEPMGIAVPIFLIENISLPDNVEAALDKRTSMGIVGDLDRFMKYQTANAIEAAAANPSGGAAGVGAGLGAGLAMANQMMGAFQPAMAGPAMAVAPPPPPAAAAYFLAIHGQQHGPFDGAALQQRVAGGLLTRETHVWKPGMGAWALAGTVPELAPLFAAVPPPIPPG
jgi:hypothetical protein